MVKVAMLMSNSRHSYCFVFVNTDIFGLSTWNTHTHRYSMLRIEILLFKDYKQEYSELGVCSEIGIFTLDRSLRYQRLNITNSEHSHYFGHGKKTYNIEDMYLIYSKLNV